ncbi:hypothetical protein HD597_008941 [Nonomuraea thailandensis]|uniref:Lipoprotein n=1 Tax=Nonomuraea thailandensis TaxID=1188745 RepID=A0A9X2GUD8_9ACTN|nr:hypothetical protein [Nonomuraea thailandensis]MCP2361921.1 hypothetical protein [Nonomuraea thailandensis]
MRSAAMVLCLLLAAGCAAPERPYRPREGAPAGVASATPAAPEERSSSGPETIEVADGLKARVEWPANPDPLLKVMVDQYVGTRKAVAERRRTYKDGLELDAAVQASEWVESFAAEGWSMRGVGRLYDLRVSARVGKGAQIDACVDESGVRMVSTRTGKAVSPQPEWLRTPYGQSVAARRGDDGVWRIRTYVPSRERCTR